MNLFKKPKYLLMILLASFTFVTFVPQFAEAQAAHVPLAPNQDPIQQAEQRTAAAGGKVDLSDVGDWLAKQLGTIVYFFTIKLPSIILLLEIKMFNTVGTYNNFTGQDQVKQAWVTVRDLANMFFILILLLMSFGTILQVQGFGYRQLLSKLLLMAILINFSKSIVALLIDFSQIITLTFLAPVLENLAGNYVVALGLQKIMNLPSGVTGTYTGVSYLMAMILGGIMMIITTVIMGVILIMFVMRIISFWILIILAPMAFLARAFPKTSTYYGQWEGELSKNLTTGPALAFFMWLAFSIVGQGSIASSFPENNTAPDGTKYVNETKTYDTVVSEVADTANMLNFVIAITLLMAGLKFAASSGVAGASVAGKASGSLQKWGSRIGRGATIGAAAGAAGFVAGGAARLAWQGTSGEGGAKGIIGQTRGFAGRGLAVTGEALGIGAMQRAGLGLKNKEDARREKKKAYFAKRLEGMSLDERQAYLDTYKQDKIGKHLLGAREAAGLSQKNKLDRGIEMAGIDPRDMSDADRIKYYGTADLSKIDQSKVNDRMAARAQEMAADFERSGDKASLDKLKTRSAAVSTTDSVRQLIDEKDVTALARVNFAGASNEIIDLVLSQEAKALGEMVDKMDEKKRDVFMQVIQARKTSATGLSGAIDNDKTQAGKAFVLQSRFANDRTGMSEKAAVAATAATATAAAIPAQAAITNSVTREYEELKALDPARAIIARDNVERASTGAQMARISRDETTGHISLYDDVTGVTDDTKFNEVVRSSTTSRAPAARPRGTPLGTAPISRSAQLAANRVEHGNIESALANSTTRKHVTEDQIHAHIGPQVAGLPTANDEINEREKFAREHLGKAKEYFGGRDRTGTPISPADQLVNFGNFVQDLNLKELQALNSKDLAALLPTVPPTPGAPIYLTPEKVAFIRANVL